MSFYTRLNNLGSLNQKSLEVALIKELRNVAIKQKESKLKGAFEYEIEFNEITSQLTKIDECMDYEIIFRTNSHGVKFPAMVVLYDEDELEYKRYKLA